MTKINNVAISDDLAALLGSMVIDRDETAFEVMIEITTETSDCLVNALSQCDLENKQEHQALVDALVGMNLIRDYCRKINTLLLKDNA